MEPKHKLSKRIHGSVLNINRKYTKKFNKYSACEVGAVWAVVVLMAVLWMAVVLLCPGPEQICDE